MPHFHIRIRERHRLMLLLVFGLAASILFLRQAGGQLEEGVRSGGQDFLIKLAQETVKEQEQGLGREQSQGQGEPESRGEQKMLFRKILQRRIWLPAAWIVLSFTALGLLSLYLFWLYLGFSMGILLWTVMVYGGWRGPFYFWGLVFPQYLAYMPALLLIYVGCLRWNGFWREKRRYVKKMPFGSPQFRIFLLRLALGIGLYSVGIWAEMRLNPWFIKRIFIKL